MMRRRFQSTLLVFPLFLSACGEDYPFRTQDPFGLPPSIHVESPTSNPRPVWSWDFPGDADRVRFWLDDHVQDRVEASDVVSWTPEADLPPGDHTLNLQFRTGGGAWSPIRPAAVTITLLKPYGYRDFRFSYYGRYHDDGDNMYSGWREGWIRFKVTGTRQLRIVVRAHLIRGCLPEVNAFVDDIPRETGFGGPIPEQPGDPMERDLVIGTDSLSPDEHLVELRLATGSGDIRAPLRGTDRVGLVRVEMDHAGQLLPWPQAGKWKLAVFSDSWAGHYPHYFDPAEFSVHNMSQGGFTSYDGAYWYPWTVLGVPHRDPRWDAVLIHYGLNDFNAGVAPKAFQANVLRLVQSIRKDQPEARIFLVQLPRNLQTGRSFDVYGRYLEEIAGQQLRVDYIPSRPIWDSLQWFADQTHITHDSHRKYGDWLSREMSARMP